MVSMDLSIRDDDGQAVVALRGDLDVAEAVSVAAALARVADRAEIVAGRAGSGRGAAPAGQADD